MSGRSLETVLRWDFYYLNVHGARETVIHAVMWYGGWRHNLAWFNG